MAVVVGLEMAAAAAEEGLWQAHLRSRQGHTRSLLAAEGVQGTTRVAHREEGSLRWIRWLPSAVAAEAAAPHLAREQAGPADQAEVAVGLVRLRAGQDLRGRGPRADLGGAGSIMPEAAAAARAGLARQPRPARLGTVAMV